MVNRHHAARREDRIGDVEADVRPGHRQHGLHDAVGVVQATGVYAQENAPNRPKEQPNDDTAEEEDDDVDDDIRRELALHLPVEEDRPEDHGHAVVEQRLATDDHGERVGRTELLEKGDHGDGVGGRHDRAKGQAQVPAPVRGARDDILDDDGEESRSDGDAREGERGALAQAVFEDVEIEVHRVAKDQRRDEGVEQQVAVHGFPDVEAARQVLVGAFGFRGNPRDQTDDQDERSVRDGWTAIFV